MDIHIAKYSEISSSVLNIFLSFYKEKLKCNERISCVISGGRGPRGFYKLLNESDVDFSKIDFFISDERYTNAIDNLNWVMIEKLLFYNKRNYNFFRIDTKLPDPAKDYEKKISNFLKFRKFDFLFLGIGSDGHIASLFDTYYDDNSYVIYTQSKDPSTPTRITLNYPALNMASRCIFIVAGSGKEKIKYDIVSKNTKIYPFGSITVPSVFFLTNDD